MVNSLLLNGSTIGWTAEPTAFMAIVGISYPIMDICTGTLALLRQQMTPAIRRLLHSHRLQLTKLCIVYGHQMYINTHCWTQLEFGEINSSVF